MQLSYIILTILISSTYCGLLIYLIHVWNKINNYVIPQSRNYLPLSIVIAARNESNNINSCLSSIIKAAKVYPGQIQVIVIDDHSKDETVSIVESFASDNIELIQLKDHLTTPINAYKKAAISLGIQKAAYTYIIQLDADIVIPQKYFNSINSGLQNTKADFLAGPVHFRGEGYFSAFQSLDMLGMLGVIAVGIESGHWFMANGANMIYKKGIFTFDNNDFASGDDVFAIQQVFQSGKQINFLKCQQAAVSTNTEPKIKDFLSQRLRWATKNKMMKSNKMLAMMSIPFINSLILLGHLVVLLFWREIALAMLAFHFSLKGMIDFIYLSKLSEDLEYPFSPKEFWYASLLTPVYLSAVGLMSLVVKKYTWKGRRVK